MSGRADILVLGWLILGLPAGACIADTAYLHPEAIFEGDIAELVIEHDSKIPSLYALDTAPLEKDFEILDSRSRVIRLDGASSDLHRMQWRLQLLPRRSGRLAVPALAFGDRSSPPLILEVKSVSAAMRAGQDIFIEIEVEPDTPYVGQQTHLVLRLFHNTPIRIDGLAEPRIDDATLFHDQDENIYFIERDAGEFRVLERHFDFIPHSAGPLQLPPAVFRGELREAEEVESNLPGRKISRRSEALLIEVREPPTRYRGRFWLPARDLEISQRLEAPSAELEIGDSIDWVLSLVARGLTAESLPANLLEIESDNFTVYADQAVRSNRFEGDDLVGRLDQRFAVIVTGPGPIDLPVVTLDWWDLDAETERQARIESNRVGIARPAGRGNDKGDAIEIFLSPDSGEIHWPRLAGLLALLGLLLAGASALRRLSGPYLEALLRRRRIRIMLRQACLDNNAARARSSAIEWGRARWPWKSVNGLFAIGECSGNEALGEELARLDAALFAPRETRWQGKRLWRLISAEERRSRTAGQAARSASASLYPD